MKADCILLYGNALIPTSKYAGTFRIATIQISTIASVKGIKMFYKNNWFSYAYDSKPFGHKNTPSSEFTIELSPTVISVKSYYEELKNNAMCIRDMFTGTLDLLFSGGIDSEVVLRIYNDLQIPINVYIFKYENNYNYKEFNQAIKICESLDSKYTVIDFNLEKFFENEAYGIWSKVNCKGSGWLPHMKMTEYLDGTPIIGSGDPYWIRASKDLTVKQPWKFEIDEGAKAWSVYHKHIQRNVVTDWYEYSPEMIISHLNLPLIQKLINDQIPGKLSSFSSKAVVHKEIWPDIDIRPKLVGFEGDNPAGYSSKPAFMLDFDNIYCTDVSSKKYYFTEEELRKKLIV